MGNQWQWARLETERMTRRDDGHGNLCFKLKWQ